MRTTNAARRLLGFTVLASLTLLTACSYSLQGRVVRGDYSAVEVVDSSDPRLSDPKTALSGVAVSVQADPNKINRKTLGRAVSARGGEFSLPVDEFGAGVLDYDVGVFARKKGYEPAEGFYKLPGGSRRILITMTPGQDTGTSEQPGSLREEFGRELNR